MVSVPAGPFVRGSAPGWGEHDELPQRRVVLPSFFIDRTEVTVGTYRRCVDSGACSSALVGGNSWVGKAFERSPVCNYPWADRELHPMNCLSWEEAAAYCLWVGKRLPSESEWEKAARGQDGRLFPWGDHIPGPGDRLGNFADESGRRQSPRWKILAGYDDGYVATSPVGLFRAGASPWGVLDLAGNVWEWAADWYSPTAYSIMGEEQSGPPSGELRVVRGGSFESEPERIRCAERNAFRPIDRAPFVGFRCAADRVRTER